MGQPFVQLLWFKNVCGCWQLRHFISIILFSFYWEPINCFGIECKRAWGTPFFQILSSFSNWLPSFGLILLHGNISFLHLLLYFSFIFSCILTIQFLLLSYKNTRPIFYSLITLFFLWGTNIVIESIPLMYDVLAPLSMSYHYTLVTEGILHVSTAIYIILLPLTFFGSAHANHH